MPAKERRSQVKRTKASAPSSSSGAILSTPPKSQDKTIGQTHDLESSSQLRQDVASGEYDDQDEILAEREDRYDADLSSAIPRSEAGPLSALQTANHTITLANRPLPKNKAEKRTSASTPRKGLLTTRKSRTVVKSKAIEVDNRPQPHGFPLVWADVYRLINRIWEFYNLLIYNQDRQALCDSLPYYRAFQSGAYTSKGLAHGFLLDRDSGDNRAYMDEEVVITRA